MMSLFEDFISSCAFIHDDSIGSRPQVVDSDWDLHGTKPFLLGSQVCVARSLEGFGNYYLEYLDSLDSLPKVLIIPRHQEHSLLFSLLNDDLALNQLKTVVLEKKLDISTYYSNSMNVALISKLTTQDFSPSNHPPVTGFSLANDKIRIHTLLRDARIPTPLGTVCSCLQDLRHFYNQVRQRCSKILVKKGHWDTLVINNRDDIERFAESIEFPVLSEIAYPVKLSPVCHNLVWKGTVCHLFTLLQVIQDFHWKGNKILSDLPPDIDKQIKDYSYLIIEQISQYSGVFGIDFIITPDDELYVVDITLDLIHQPILSIFCVGWG